jgi:diaminopimelate decarboxylase
MALAPFGRVSPQAVVQAAALCGTPFYLYDEAMIVERCRDVLAMPSAFGLTGRYAMKANPGRAILELVSETGMGVDASSLNEVRRARRAGVPAGRIMLTSQEVPEGQDRRDLEELMRDGLVYNACSQLQLERVAPFARASGVELSVRVNPGVGAGESVTRNTGDKYSSFGVHLAGLERLTSLARDAGVVLGGVHVHIGSGGDPAAWRENIDRMLEIVERFFPDARTVDLGGGFKEARMPDEQAADVAALGRHAKDRFEAFAARTGRRLHMSVEPGTYLVANAGYLVTRVVDRKWSGPGGFEFLVTDGGMEANTRPLLYGSRHPFYVISRAGELLSSEWNLNDPNVELDFRVVVGRCCESGDSQSLDHHGHIIPRMMADAQVGDFLVVGGAGAYCSAMSPFNYNSHLQAPEVLLAPGGSLQVVRRAQSLDQVVANEVGRQAAASTRIP